MSRGSSKMTLIASLYVSQAVPLGFFIVALPAILRDQGHPLETIGLFSALALPWLIKFLWAPLVDRYGARRGHYRSWILPLQTLSVLAVVALGFASPAQGLTALAVFGAAFMLFAATQDIATDGLTVRILKPQERGVGNGLQVGGYYLGQILGGGLVLVLFDRFGWPAAMGSMALCLALPLVPVYRFAEGRAPEDEVSRHVRLGAIVAFLSRPGAAGWVLLLLIYRSGDAMAITMLNPMLVDRGLPLSTIGVMTGVAFSAGALGGALLGGWLVGIVGRRPGLALFACVHAVALAGLLLPATGRAEIGMLYGVIVFVAFAGGLSTAALYTNMMDRSDRATAATDFTLQQSLCAIGPVVGSVLSGRIAAGFGYVTLFAVCIVVSLVAAALAARRATEVSARPVADLVPGVAPRGAVR